MAWYQGRSQFATRRTTSWRSIVHKSTCTCNGRQLWCLGWYVLYIRLRRERISTKRGRMECDHLWIHDWWLSGGTEWAKICFWISCSMRHSSGRIRRSGCCAKPNVQRGQPTNAASTPRLNARRTSTRFVIMIDCMSQLAFIVFSSPALFTYPPHLVFSLFRVDNFQLHPHDTLWTHPKGLRSLQIDALDSHRESSGILVQSPC